MPSIKELLASQNIIDKIPAKKPVATKKLATKKPVAKSESDGE